MARFSHYFGFAGIALLLASLAILSVPVEAGSPLTLSGSSDGSGTITVDDDLDIYLNGVQIYTDGTAGAGARAPISVSANPGDTLRFVVRDTYGACASLSTIYLTNHTGQFAIADPGFNLGCGRPSTDQGVVDEFTFTVPKFSAKGGGARIWYVSQQSGTDTTCAFGGTSDSPFRTIAMAAVVCAGAGDTVSIEGTDTEYVYIQTSTLVISKKLFIVGAGSVQPEISGGGLVQVLQNVSGDLTIRDVTIDGGGKTSTGGGIYNAPGAKLTLSRVTVTLSSAEFGGGIYNAGTLTATGGAISSNKAKGGFSGRCSLGAGISGDGGGIYNAVTGSVKLIGVTVASNQASSTGCASGGGIFNLGSLALSSVSNVSNNTVPLVGTGGTNGGGIYNLDGDVTVDNSTVNGNAAGVGGGIANVGNTLTMQNSTVIGNGASTWGGGIYNSNNGGTTTLNAVTISGNSAGEGGGIYNYDLTGPADAGVVVFKKGMTTFSGNTPEQCKGTGYKSAQGGTSLPSSCPF